MSDPVSDPRYTQNSDPLEPDLDRGAGVPVEPTIPVLADPLDDPLDRPLNEGATYPAPPAGVVAGSAGSAEYGSQDESGSGSATAEQASRVAGEAAEGGKHVAQVAKQEASSVASEAGAQARNLLGEARSQLTSQASDQKGSLVSYLRSFVDDVDGMVSGRTPESGVQDGPARHLAQRASGYAQQASSWLDEREPAQIVDEVSRFARRRPGTFLLIAAAAGVVAGRLTRGLTGGDDSGQGNGQGNRQVNGTEAYGYGRPAPVQPTPAYLADDYAGTGYAPQGYGSAGLAEGERVGEAPVRDEFGLPELTSAPGEPGYDDRGTR